MADEEKRVPFQTGDKIEDMMSYARKLNALGDLLQTLFWIGNACDTGQAELQRFGQELGWIMQDYSQALEIMLDESSCSFVDLDKNVVFPLGRCQEVYDFIGNNRRKEDICAVDYHLQELNNFIENAAMPAMRLKNSFEDLKKEMLAGNKSAPEAVRAAAGA